MRALQGLGSPGQGGDQPAPLKPALLVGLHAGPNGQQHGLHGGHQQQHQQESEDEEEDSESSGQEGDFDPEYDPMYGLGLQCTNCTAVLYDDAVCPVRGLPGPLCAPHAP